MSLARAGIGYGRVFRVGAAALLAPARGHDVVVGSRSGRGSCGAISANIVMAELNAFEFRRALPSNAFPGVSARERRFHRVYFLECNWAPRKELRRRAC